MGLVLAPAAAKGSRVAVLERVLQRLTTASSLIPGCGAGRKRASVVWLSPSEQKDGLGILPKSFKIPLTNLSAFVFPIET